MCKNYDTSRRSFVTTLIVVAICLVIVTGSTFSLFTSKTGANIAVTAGKVEMTAVIDAATLALYSKGEPQTGKFYNGGSANFNDKHTELTLINVTPGDSVSFNIVLTNDSTVDLQYRVTWTRDNALAPVLDATVDGASINSGTSVWTLWEADSAEKTKTLTVVIELPIDVNDDYELASATIGFAVEAVQANATEEYEDMINPPVIPPVKETVKAPETNDAGETTEPKEIPASEGGVAAIVPEGVKLADGADELTLTVKQERESQANITLGGTETAVSLDVHIEGIADDNTIPMEITIPGVVPKGLNNGNLKLYHVENGATIEMTQVAMTDAFTAHNQFKYDAVTGELILNMASFSEVAVVADVTNTWNGTAATAFGGGNGTEANPYLISNADQLAYFRNQVDGGRTFDNEFVKLENNIYLSNVNFDPIGWGYEYNDWNVGDQDGKPFKGTFDGNGKTIYDLYQNGWDLTNAGTGEAYTYTNCGFGLFAAAADATFKNLTIYNANIVAECVEMGILVGLSQGSCTYENINIHNSKIANYQRPAGGLIGEVSPLNGGGETKITNVQIGSDVVVGSLWGDFDAPVGGVIGARWDDSNTTTVKMKDVDVGCHLDVYNDVTSTYQWYAYRRAGMLIGNTEYSQKNENGTNVATADFLTCENVKVYYGSWVNYHYCEFSDFNSSWPFVRAEAGENCTAFSNPRWGVPELNGVKVTPANHPIKDQQTTHANGDDCMVLLQFNQLYGGGQGVYGQPEHEGVEVINYRYSITYVNDDVVLSIQYVTEDMAQKTNPFIPNDKEAKDAAVAWVKSQGYDNIVFDEWVTAGSKKAEIPATNTENVTVYPSFKTPYTARFVDLDGNVLDWCFFDNKTTSNIAATQENAFKLLPPQDTNIVEFSHWEVHYYDKNGSAVTETYNSNNFKGDHYKTDVTIYPVYKYAGKLNLEPVDSDGDGKTNYYKVVATAALDATTTIPGEVLGIPVLVVEKLYKQDGNTDYSSNVVKVVIQEGVERLEHNAISHTAKLNTVEIPHSMKYIGKNAFSRNNWIGGLVGGGSDKKELTIVYNGTMAEWKAIEKDGDWDNGLEKVSYIKCTDGEFRLEDSGLFGAGSAWYEYPNS